MSDRRIVLVSGCPGAGKSTLAGPLAAALGLPLLSKDVIKETLHDVLGDQHPDPVESSRRLGAAAMTVLWRLAARCPEAVLEANFRAEGVVERAEVAALCPRPVEVHCKVPPEVAAARFAARATTPGHHEVHSARMLSIEDMALYRRPLGLGPVIEVDTTLPVDIGELAARVRAELGPGGADRGDGRPGSVAAP